MEMIGLAEKIEGIISKIENTARKEGRKDIINRLLKKIYL